MAIFQQALLETGYGKVKEGETRLRLLISDDEIGTMPVPESGWFLVPGQSIYVFS